MCGCVYVCDFVGVHVPLVKLLGNNKVASAL